MESSRHDTKEEIKPDTPVRISTTPREGPTGLDDFLNDDDDADNEDEEDDSDEYTDDSEDDEDE